MGAGSRLVGGHELEHVVTRSCRNLRRRHYEITTGQAPHDLLPAAFAELAHCL